MSNIPNHPSDPRPDKISDHKHWKDILWNAWHIDKNLYGVLHGVRCGGAEIVLTATSFMLMPGDWAQGEWDSVKEKYLTPYKEQMIQVFKLSRFALISEEKIPDEFLENKGGFGHGSTT